MKRTVAAVTFLVTLSPLSFADDKPTIESECKAIAESHGVTGEKLDDWMKRCIDRTKEMQHRMGEASKPHGESGHGDMGDMHGKSKSEGQ